MDTPPNTNKLDDLRQKFAKAEERKAASEKAAAERAQKMEQISAMQKKLIEQQTPERGASDTSIPPPAETKASQEVFKITRKLRIYLHSLTRPKTPEDFDPSAPYFKPAFLPLVSSTSYENALSVIDTLVKEVEIDPHEADKIREILNETEGAETEGGENDPMYEEAVRIVREVGSASTSTLQRRLRLDYKYAAQILDTMYRNGIIGPSDGSKPREVLGLGENLDQTPVPPTPSETGRPFLNQGEVLTEETTRRMFNEPPHEEAVLPIAGPENAAEIPETKNYSAQFIKDRIAALLATVKEISHVNEIKVSGNDAKISLAIKVTARGFDVGIKVNLENEKGDSIVAKDLQIDANFIAKGKVREIVEPKIGQVSKLLKEYIEKEEARKIEGGMTIKNGELEVVFIPQRQVGVGGAMETATPAIQIQTPDKPQMSLDTDPRLTSEKLKESVETQRKARIAALDKEVAEYRAKTDPELEEVQQRLVTLRAKLFQLEIEKMRKNQPAPVIIPEPVVESIPDTQPEPEIELEKNKDEQEIAVDKKARPLLYFVVSKVTNPLISKSEKGKNADLRRMDWIKNQENSCELTYSKLQPVGIDGGFFEYNLYGFVLVIKNVKEITGKDGVYVKSPNAIYQIVGPDGNIVARADNILGYDAAKTFYNAETEKYRIEVEKEFNAQQQK
jgi:hypothetical protein